MIPRISLLCLAVCCLNTPVLAQKDPAPKKKYRVKLFRPAKSGDSYRLTASESKKQLRIVSRDGKTLQTNSTNTRVELEADVTVLKVDEKGGSLKKSIVIERFVDGKQNELLQKGQVVIAETIEGTTVFRMKTGQLPVAARIRLIGLVETQSPDSTDDDALFGSKQDRAIGEKWKVDPAAVARQLKVDAKTVNGTVTLSGRKTIDGVDCLLIAAEINIGSISLAKQIMDEGFQLKDPSVVAKITANYPVDTKIGSTGRTLTVTMKATAIGDKPKTKGLVVNLSKQIASEKRRVYHK